MKKILLALALLLALPAAFAGETISRYAGPWPIVIKTCDHDAGAICSLNWRGKEFINDYDHGRQLQSAVSFDGRGESYNPTESGASIYTDGVNPRPSSSKLLYSLASASALTTQTQMAYWNPVSGVKLSNIIHEKRVRIGLPGMAHVIEYLTEFTIPPDERHFSGTFEVLTGYMPAEFSMFWTYDVRNNAPQPVPLSDGPGEQGLPVIFSTPDKGWAMGVYSPGSPQPEYLGAGYGRWRFPQDGVVKWNNVYRIANPAGTYRFKTYVFVGSLDNVVVSMQQLYWTLGQQGLPR